MGKRLVAFFSASGTTKRVAEMIASAVDADMYEIMPKQPYSKADLNWMDKKSRSSVEMSDKKFRPEISDIDVSVEQYNLLHPIHLPYKILLTHSAISRFSAL